MTLAHDGRTGQFPVIPGLDAHGDYIVTSALADDIVTNGNTACATVAADTVTAMSDNDVTRLIGEDG